MPLSQQCKRLLQLLRDSRNDIVYEAAAFALLRFASNTASGAAEIVACGGAAPLVLRLGSSSMFVQAAAALALANLTRNEALTAAVIREGALSALVRVLHSSGNADVLEQVAAALTTLVAAGCIPRFVRLLSTSSANGVWPWAADALCRLVAASGSSVAAVIEAAGAAGRHCSSMHTAAMLTCKKWHARRLSC